MCFSVFCFLFCCFSLIFFGPVAAHGAPSLTVDLEIPALATPGENVPLVYQASEMVRFTGSTVKPLEAGAETPLVTPTSSALGLYDVLEFSLSATGRYLVTANFVSATGTAVRATASIQVIEKAEAGWLETVEAWQVPGHTLYFSPVKADVKNSQKEQIRWANSDIEGFGTLPEQTFWQVRAWNALAAKVRPSWLPPRSLVRTGIHTLGETQPAVFYAPFVRGAWRGVFYGEIGQQSWFYLEQNAPAPAGQKAPDAADVFRPDVPEKTESAHQTGRSNVLARTLVRQRAFAPQGKPELVRILLAHWSEASTLTLQMPIPTP